MSAVTQSGLVPQYARRQRQQRDNDADGNWTDQYTVVIARHDKGPERHDPSAHTVKFEAVRAVAQDVAERGAIAQNRSEIQQMSGCRDRLLRGEPEAH